MQTKVIEQKAYLTITLILYMIPLYNVHILWQLAVQLRERTTLKGPK